MMDTKPARAMTLARAREIAGNCGRSLTRKPGGEYRLAPRGLAPAVAEAQAYYTNDLDDAVGTALSEFKHERRAKDVAMMSEPARWPRFPVLPLMRHNGDTDQKVFFAADYTGFMHANTGFRVFFGNIHEKPPAEIQYRDYASYEAIAADYKVD